MPAPINRAKRGIRCSSNNGLIRKTSQGRRRRMPIGVPSHAPANRKAARAAVTATSENERVMAVEQMWKNSSETDVVAIVEMKRYARIVEDEMTSANEVTDEMNYTKGRPGMRHVTWGGSFPYYSNDERSTTAAEP